MLNFTQPSLFQNNLMELIESGVKFPFCRHKTKWKEVN